MMRITEHELRVQQRHDATMAALTLSAMHAPRIPRQKPIAEQGVRGGCACKCRCGKPFSSAKQLAQHRKSTGH